MPKLFAWIASWIASVYRSLPLGPRMWMRSLLAQSPKRSFISLLVWQGMEFEEPSFILGRPVLAIAEKRHLLPCSETSDKSISSALGLRGIIRIFFREGKLAKAETAHLTVFRELFSAIWKRSFLSLKMPFRLVMSLQLAWRMASVYSLSSKTFGSIASRFCEGFLAPGHSPEL